MYNYPVTNTRKLVLSLLIDFAIQFPGKHHKKVADSSFNPICK